MWFTAAASLQLTELRLEVKLEKIVYVMVSTHLMYRETLMDSLLHRTGLPSLRFTLWAQQCCMLCTGCMGSVGAA